MTEFKKGDRIIGTSFAGTPRYGIFEELRDNNLVYAYWGDSFEEAERKSKSSFGTTWISLSRVKLDDSVVGKIYKDPTDGLYMKVLAVVNGKFVISRWGNNTEGIELEIPNSIYGSIERFEEVDPSGVVELTLSEIAEKLDIDVEKLRIKE